METTLIITKVEIDELLKMLPAEEAQRTLSFIDALKVFDRSADKKRCAAELAARLEPLGYKGISLKSLYRKLDQFRKVGVWACVDKRVARRVTAQGIATNSVFVEAWHARVLSNRRKVKPAWRALIADLVNGVAIPGVGTWREMYASTYGYRPAVDEPCPWSALNPPPGWSLRNLMQLKPDDFALTAARIGMGAAKIDFLPTVRLTRVGLLPCQVVEVDDMWYEHVVHFGRNLKPQRVVEFAAMDRLTGHVICHLAKPVIEKDDGTRSTFKSAWVRYLYHYLLCVVGVPAEGCLIKGEHGTASEDATFGAALAAINAVRKEASLKPVVFRAGAIVTQPLAKGLADVKHHGNPRHKGMIEQMHATLKHYADSLIFGNVGGGRDVQPEETIGLVREDAALVKIAAAKPALASRLRFNFPTWSAFVVAAEEAHRRMDERTDHQLEGWEECGFTVTEVKYPGSPHWQAVGTPYDGRCVLPGEPLAGVQRRVRRMSPAEAWTFARLRTELEKVSPGFTPLILGKELAHAATVGDKLTMDVRDRETGERYTVAAIIDGVPLSRGAKCLVWVNPMDVGKAYVQDAQGRFLGVAKVLQAVRADADATVPELQEQLGLRSSALAEERRRLDPLVRKRLQERSDAAAANLAALGMEDPAERAEIEGRAAGELADGEAADGVDLEAPGEGEPTADVDAADLDSAAEPDIPSDDFVD